MTNTEEVQNISGNMNRFASLLRLMRQPQLAQNYESLAERLRADSSAQTVNDAREWVTMTFRGTSGSLTDQYIQKEDGAVDPILTKEYEELLQKLTDFANGS